MSEVQTPYELRPSRPGDEPELSRLWQKVFGDSPEFIAEFFARIYRPGDAVLAIRDGVLVSAGYCLSGVRAGELRCSYIYSMATEPEFRSQGAARAVGLELLRLAFLRGDDLVATLPADAGLTKWYENALGMRRAFRKGGEGAEFPESFIAFSEFCGRHDPNTPKSLWAVRRDGGDVSPLSSLGWECVFD
ncbi:MAG: GNAT family N-acetyltransferase [Oscillospiraceae bacterium]